MSPETPTVRPRYGRIAALSLSVALTGTAVLGGVGVLPAGGQPSYAATRTPATGVAADATSEESGDSASLSADEQQATDSPSESPATGASGDVAVPEDSGEGRRVVFDQGAQRVWLVKADGSVERTYLVSGSIYDNLEPGTYSVYSRSKRAWGVDDSGTMRFMVRFAHGTSAAIGFHDIPVLDGEKVQPRTDLGAPQSHGCIRQKTPDAKALWDFAPLGTTVVVVDTSAEPEDS